VCRGAPRRSGPSWPAPALGARGARASVRSRPRSRRAPWHTNLSSAFSPLISKCRSGSPRVGSAGGGRGVAGTSRGRREAMDGRTARAASARAGRMAARVRCPPPHDYRPRAAGSGGSGCRVPLPNFRVSRQELEQTNVEVRRAFEIREVPRVRELVQFRVRRGARHGGGARSAARATSPGAFAALSCGDWGDHADHVVDNSRHCRAVRDGNWCGDPHTRVAKAHARGRPPGNARRESDSVPQE
jgi:hypothetical protein